jgi:dynein intermediate chain
MAWDRNPVSRKVALGSSDGNVYIYDVADKLVQPRDNEWVEMQKRVQGLTASRDQGGGLGTVELPSASGSRYKTSMI